jgi:hypothetical protein
MRQRYCSLGLLKRGKNMKASFKDRSIVILLLLIFILVVSALVYFNFAKPKTTGMLTSSTEIIKLDNLQQIEINKKYGTPYAFKVQDNNKYYLRYFAYENSKPSTTESKYELTKDQYSKLVEGSKYWFMVKFSNADNTRDGIVKDLFTEDPAKR